MSALKTLRTKKKFSREAVAAYVGVTTGSIKNWEEKEIRPNLKKALKLAEFLDIPLDDLQKLFA